VQGTVLGVSFFTQKLNIMDKMNDLKALLKHDVQMLVSVEDQIIEALPAMIKRASSPQLKKALDEHLNITKRQRQRLDQVNQLLGSNKEDVTRYSGVLANLMGGVKCKGMDGIIEEGEKLMAENISDEVMDAAIIGASQKIEHFEIASYGTARTFAQELGLSQVAQLLQQTLDEEYMADQELTGLAEQRINQQAISGSSMSGSTMTGSTMSGTITP
jgi:ferritin-like metal-binding protein YciE